MMFIALIVHLSFDYTMWCVNLLFDILYVCVCSFLPCFSLDVLYCCYREMLQRGDHTVTLFDSFYFNFIRQISINTLQITVTCRTCSTNDSENQLSAECVHMFVHKRNSSHAVEQGSYSLKILKI